MSQLCLPDVKDLQSMDGVIELLQEGIESICNICTALTDAHVDLNTGECSTDRQISELINHADQCLKRSEKMIKEKLRCLDEHMELLLKEKECLKQKLTEKKMTIDKLHQDKTCAENIFHNSKMALEQAEKNLTSEKKSLAKEEERKSSSVGLIIGGVVAYLAPIIGWIAGPIMIATGVQGKHDTSIAIRAAEEEIEKAESQVREYKSKVSLYQFRISEAQKEIEKTKEDMNTIQKKIEDLKQNLVVISEIQEVVREAVHHLSILSGRATVLQKQTQHSIIWEPVMKVMKEVMKAAIKIAENQLLYSRGLEDLKNTLRENNDRLLAICNSQNSSEYWISEYY